MKTEACNTELRECRRRKRERDLVTLLQRTWWHLHRDSVSVCKHILNTFVNKISVMLCAHKKNIAQHFLTL